MCWTLLSGCLVFLGFAGFITLFGLHDRIEPADVLVVFGNTVYPDGTLSPRLQARLDRAIALARAEVGDYILVSGSLGKEGVEESEAMKKYLLAHSIPADRILQDPHGINTEETAKQTMELLKEKNLTSVLLVSQFFHLARAQVAFHRVGISVVGHVHAEYYEGRDLYALLREVVALPVYWLQ